MSKVREFKNCKLVLKEDGSGIFSIKYEDCMEEILFFDGCLKLSGVESEHCIDREVEEVFEVRTLLKEDCCGNVVGFESILTVKEM